MKQALLMLFSSVMLAVGQAQYAFTNFAGMPGGPGNVDGRGSAARFHGPIGVAVDSAGNVYVADTLSSTIRKITPGGAVTTLAGCGTCTFAPVFDFGSGGAIGSTDGTGSAARFFYPYGVAADSTGNVYLADYGNSTIRKITPAGEVTTLAGSPRQRGSANGIGSEARFFNPAGVGVDGSGNMILFADGHSASHDFTHAVKDDPAYPMEPTKDWMWYKPKQ